MADIPRLVDEIRGFLLSNDQSLKPHLPELASGYAEACVEANQRLAQCQRLLQQGLRVEAIHLAKESPDLLDTAQALEFPERPAWLEIVGQYALATPPGLDPIALEFLQSAFAEANPLEELLRGHRRLALARAPLRLRIDVLRKLVVADANNPIWAADVQTFESARIEQLKGEVAEARRRPDAIVLSGLNDELSAPSWSVPPPKALVQGVKQALGQIRQTRVREDLGGLVAALNDAFASLDAEAAREIRKLWYQLDGKNGVKGTDPLFEQVEPAFLWLGELDRQEEEERRYGQAVADLAAALEDAAPRDELDRLRDDLLGLEGGVPDDLEARYRVRLGEIARARAGRLRIALAALVVVIAALGAFAWVLIRGQSRDLEAKRLAQLIETSIPADRLAEARSEFARVAAADPGLAALPIVAEAESRLKKAEAAEARRVSQFEAAFREAESAPLAAAEPPALSTARTRARTGAEKAKVEDLAARRRADLAGETARNEEEAKPRLDALAEKFAELDRLLADPDGDDGAGEILKEVSAELASLAPRVGRAGDDVGTLHRVASERATVARKELEARGRWRVNEPKIGRALAFVPPRPDDYAKTLNEVSLTIPGTPRAAALRQVAGEKAAWAGALLWAELARGWQASGPPSGPADAKARADRCARLVAENRQLPDLDLVQEYRRHCEAIAARTEGDGNLRGKLDALFSHPVIADVYLVMVRDKIQRDFVFYSKAERDAQRKRLRVIDGFDDKSHEITVADSDLVRQEVAPHSRLAAEFRRELEREPTLKGWDSLLLSFARRVAEASDIDPLLRLGLLKQVLIQAGKGSLPLAVALAPTLDKIEKSEIEDNLPWMNPLDHAVTAARPKADRTLKELPPWESVERKSEEARKGLADRLAASPRPVGWLVKGKEWACRTSETLPDSGELLVVVPGRPRGGWKSIGRLTNGTVKISALEPSSLVEGRIVFAMVRPGQGGP